MTSTATVTPPVHEAVRPELLLLDARELALGTAALYERARSLSDASGRPHASRSYRFPYALIGWGATPLGVDIERVAPCDAAFANLICTPDERAELERVEDRDRHLSSLWSAKEAVSKALGDALAYDPARLESPLRWRDGRAGAWRAEPLTLPDGYVGWVCWRATPDPDAICELSPGRAVA